MRQRIGARALILSALIVSACDSEPGGSTDIVSVPSTISPESTSHQSDTTEDLNALISLQSYSIEHEILIWNAIQQSIVECMAGAGYVYAPASQGDVRANRRLAAAVERLDIEIAEAVGYRTELLSAPEALPVESVPPPDDRNMPGFIEALEGPEGGSGCVREAETRLYGDRESLQVIFRESVLPKITELYTQADADANVVRAKAKWSSCMQAAGFDYPRPENARAAFSAIGHLTDLERTVAMQDSDCRASSRLYDLQQSALRQAVDGFLVQNVGLLERIERSRAADVAAAEAIMDE